MTLSPETKETIDTTQKSDDVTTQAEATNMETPSQTTIDDDASRPENWLTAPMETHTPTGKS